MSVLITFQELRDQIKTLSEVKTVRLFNNQFENEDENAFNYPAVMIEFLPIDWISGRRRLQKGEANIIMHIAVEEYDTENIDEKDNIEETLVIVGKVFSVLEGFSSDVIKDPLKRITSEQDTDHDLIIIWKDTYATVINDFSQCTEDEKTIIPSGTLSIDLTTQIDIDNDNIRTGDGDFS